MLEAPEARILSRQLNETVRGKTITYVSAGHTPHKFTWYHGGPDSYEDKLLDKTADRAYSYGGMVEMEIGDVRLLLCDGVNLRYYAPGEKLPAKHQLLLGFADESCLVASVRMYGGIMCFDPNDFESNFRPYYESARNKPQVMDPEFTKEYFLSLFDDPAAEKKSAKAFLATGQNIPGLGNGVLQDILYNAGIHPKTKLSALSAHEREAMYGSIVSTLAQMESHNGRNSESDLFGRAGSYIPHLSKDTAGKECTRCGSVVAKESYMGGSIYYCPGCQMPLK